MMETTTLSIIALLISFVAIWISYKNRLETNRPIVTVLIEGKGGNIATPLTIKVYNTGNTPALNISLNADKEDINKIIVDKAPETLKKDIYGCFSKKDIIPVLHNNTSVENAFGLMSNSNNDTVKVNAKLPIIVKYENLYGHVYTQKQILHMRITGGFAGGIWRKDDTNGTAN